MADIIAVYQFHAEPPQSEKLVYNYKTTQDVDPGWTLDPGVAWYAFKSPDKGLVPVYQFYNDSLGYWRNMFWLSPNPPSGWKLVGQPFYAYSDNQGQCGLAVYELITDPDLRTVYTTNGSGPYGPGWNFNYVKFYTYWSRQG